MDLQAYAHPAELPTGEATRVARLLAIDGSETVSDVQLARHVADGLFPKAALALSDVLGRNRVVGSVIPEATFRRARKSGKTLSRDHRGRLYCVGRVVDALGRAYYGDQEAINMFLNRPHPLLDGETPFDMAHSSSAGAESVLNLIRRAQAGFPV